MRAFGCQILFLLFSFTSTGESNYHHNVCDNAIGLENGEIKDEQLSASSYRSYLFVRDLKGTFNAKAKFGRLNGTLAWCGISPSKRYRRPSPYFQVDFRQAVNVSGLATQGLSSTYSLYFVKSYAIKFSLDGNLWFDYSSPNKVWLANSDPSSVRKVYFDKPVLTNYLRIYPLTYSYRICLRVEVYGCYANETGRNTQPTDMSPQSSSRLVSTTPSPTMKKIPSHLTHNVSTIPSPTMKKIPSHMTHVLTTSFSTINKTPSSKPNIINSSLPLQKPGVELKSHIFVTLSPSSGGMPSSRSVHGEKAWIQRKNSIVISVVVCIGFVVLCVLSFVIFLVWRAKQRRDHVFYSEFQMLGNGGVVAESEVSYKVVGKITGVPCMNIKRALFDAAPESKKIVRTLLRPTHFQLVRFLCRQMDALKAKLTNMREELDAAEEREKKSKNKTRAVRERISRAEDGRSALGQRIELMKKELEKVEDMTDEKLDRLEQLNDNIRGTESVRRKLERKELTGDGTLSDQELRCKSCQIFKEEAQQRHHESLNKLMMAERDTKIINARIRAANSNEVYFTTMLSDAGSSIGELTNSGESKQAKCDEFQERIRRLTEKKEKILLAAESMERKEQQLQRKLIPLRQEMRLVRRRGEEKKKELREMLDEMNT